MSKRKRHSPEYKRELVELVRRSQSSCRQIALEVGVVAVKDFLDSGLMVTGRITRRVSRGPHRRHGGLPPAA